MGYMEEDGPQILAFRTTITELFGLASNDMSEASGNQLQATSETQGDYMDCVNRQTSLPD